MGLVTYLQRGAWVWQNDPDTGAPWTKAAVDAAEAGMRISNAWTGRLTLQETLIEYGVPFPVPVGRAKINPPTLGPSGPSMLGAQTPGG